MPSYSQQATTKDQIIGTWTVLSLKGLTTGLVKYPLGEQSRDGLKATARIDTASSPALPGTDRVYFMKVEGNKLTMKSPG